MSLDETVKKCEIDELQFQLNMRESIKYYQQGLGQCIDLMEEVQIYKENGYKIKYYLTTDGQISFEPYKTGIGYKQ